MGKLRTFVRVILATTVAVPALALGLEYAARVMHLDARQGVPMEVPEEADAAGRVLVAYAPTPGVDYLPRRFKLDDAGFYSAFGRCDFAFQGKTFVAIGDSTTVQTTLPDGSGNEWDASWAKLLGAKLGSGWQMCVLAEVGYHPTDELDLWNLLGGKLHADAAAVLLCDNDLTGQAVRQTSKVGGKWVLFTTPDRLAQWTKDPFPKLFEASEAWRFVSWRLADMTGEARELRRDVRHRQAAEALHELDLSIHPRFYHVPPLTPDSTRVARVDELQKAASVKIVEVDLPADKVSLQRQPGDTVHMAYEGHHRLAEQVYADLFGSAQ